MNKTESPLHVTVARTDRWVVRLSGEIDASAGAELRSLAELMSTRRGGVDIDLGGVSFIDSSGWASVLATAAALRSPFRSARITNPSIPVRRLTDLISGGQAS